MQEQQQTIHDVGVETIKAMPPIAVGSLTLLGVQLSDWVLLLTAAYTVMQIGFLLRDKWWRQRHRGHK